MKKAVRALASAFLCIGLGLGIFYAVNRVDQLHRQADRLEACQKAGTSESHAQGCPKRPISEGEIKSLRETADTTGNIGWMMFFVFWVGVWGVIDD